MAPPTKKLKTCNITTFILDNIVVTSPNAEPFASFPPPQTLTYDDPDPEKTFSLNWITAEYPYLAFVISPPRFDYPLLQRLNHTFHSLPLQLSGRWRLAPALSAQWESLENTLLYIMHTVLPECNQLFPLEFSTFPPPRKHGYLRTHRNERITRESAMRSRNAFVPLMAFCSFILSFFHGANLPPNVEPKWVRVLRKTTTLHPEWLQMFRNSPILDFSGLYSRVGTVVDVGTWHYPSFIRTMVNAGVPVWFRWGPVSPPMQCSPVPGLDIYFPTGEQVDAALRAYNLQWAPIGFQDRRSRTTDAVTTTSLDHNATASPVHTASLSLIATASPVNHCTFPKPHSNSRQQYGETWQQFFKRREKRHKDIFDRENATERSARLAREKQAERFACPGKKGSAVYRWEDVDGFLLRA